MAEDLIKLAEIFDKSSGWFLDFLAYIVAIGLVAMLVIHIYRFATGKNDWMGRSLDEMDQGGQMALIQLERCREENEELEKKVVLLEQERQDLLELVKEKEGMIEKQKKSLVKMSQEIKTLKELYEELDNRYDDETYTMSQIMYAADEIAAALVEEKHFRQNRDDIFMNLLDYLVNTFKDFREKNPRVIIHVKHPEEDVLVHYAHSSGHSHRVKLYQPPIMGSSAGVSYRTNEVYYVPDVESVEYEYDRKELSRKVYRSILCVPIKAGTLEGKTIGVLSITGMPVNAYEKIEIERAMLFASLIYPLIYIDLRKRKESENGPDTQTSG
ncbi:GAF domain-containing protein [Laceyella putida]|uniref:GAF domain-containing protein n=1 Tax=Laceyella putida TaxID=110101 RepID=A0ABW2RNF3_9BACL